MDKVPFEKPILEIIKCGTKDVVTGSGGVGGGETDPWGASEQF